MTDFRMANIPKQEAYDLLRDWIKLVARHTNPDQDISELLGWLWKLKPAIPDPITGLVPCGCGGKAMLMTIEGCVVGAVCGSCGVGTQADENAVMVWNTAMGHKGGAK